MRSIIIDIRNLLDAHRTGVGQYTKGLLDALFALDHDRQYTLFCNTRKDASNRLPTWNNVNVRLVCTRYPNVLLHTMSMIAGKPFLDQLPMKQLNNGTVSTFFSPNLNFTPLSEHTKHILTIHDLSFELLPELYTIKQRLWHKAVRPQQQCQRAHRIVVPSESTKQDLVDIYNISEEKIVVIPPGISGTTMSPKFQISNFKFQNLVDELPLPKKFILFLGTIEPRKNVDALLDAFVSARDHADMREYTLVVAGPAGWQCRETIARMQAMDSVRYLGYVDEQTKQALLHHASLFVYPSLYEGFGFPVLEAMAAGTPVITSNRSSLPEVSRGAARLIDPHDIVSIAQAMEDVLSDNAIQERMIAKGKQVAGEYTWERAARQLQPLFDTVS